MALFVANGNGCCGGRIICNKPIRNHPYGHRLLHRPQILFPFSPRRALHIVSAKKLSSRTGRFDSKNRRSSTTTRDQEDDEEEKGIAEIERSNVSEAISASKVENVGTSTVDVEDDGYFLPKLPGDEPDFWEGPQWDALGFFVQYLWAFGIVFALIACGIAVATYNEGATDFKETPAYKESIQSRELLEEPEASNSDVFESNPTEVAPSLD
ncbi:hypothetical protein P3X46_017131 [Hevea brasiliensis]|uniref:Uncharacterized protein n=2 Tax=Hevea brasiliensis TaxID=3981 RepID=A0ABQ9M3G2_HEVBR|nr:uncharacterized protein LOC110647707 [Hevea brasiliensis]KAF2298758.1 hypothetical protein GH714_026730 [Hevea brasiliensis]KAJ9174059.1 hypothetical protein P3X46_017131 [Hevea brasiliensis]KAJ9174060.1 hypothetical protein P3X46_017131 [Hevea brasiliensis]